MGVEANIQRMVVTSFTCPSDKGGTESIVCQCSKSDADLLLWTYLLGNV